jgi:SNF2 family DNA or RNA helicase
MILATLLKLKQICNHPRQFLQDESDFAPERSHKLSCLSEMVTEVMEEGESLLVFTQFTELGDALEIFVHKFVAIGTLEERIDEMIEDKKKLAGSIVGSDESWLTELDNNAFKQLITLNKSAILE